MRISKYLVLFTITLTLLLSQHSYARLDGEYRTIFLNNVVPSCVEGERGNSNFSQKQIFQWCLCKFTAMADAVTVEDIVNFSKGRPMRKYVLDVVDQASTTCMATVLIKK